MSSYRGALTLSLSLAASLSTCEAAANGPGWRVTRQGAQSLTCTEATTNALGFTSPVQVEIVLRGQPDGTTLIELKASNFGLGPIQSNHVKKQTQALRQAIELAASQPSEPQGTFTRSVSVNSQRIRDEQLAGLEREYGLRLQEGDYWYDRVCGAWGFAGGPMVGFIFAGLPIGGPLREDASNGDTSVIVNGRRLHMLDVTRLQQIMGVVLSGRWWVDAAGNFGLERGPMLGNLIVVARSRGWAVGGSHTQTGPWGVYSGGGFAGGDGQRALYAQFGEYVWSNA